MRNFIPKPAQRKDQRNHRDQKVKRVQLESAPNSDSDLDRFKNRIFFWSFSFVKVRPDTYSSKFRVYTKRLIPVKNLFELVEKVFPEGCLIKPCWKYKWRHTFDVKTAVPLTWEDFITRTCHALEVHL